VPGRDIAEAMAALAMRTRMTDTLPQVTIYTTNT
jgi:hypothetical protein